MKERFNLHNILKGIIIIICCVCVFMYFYYNNNCYTSKGYVEEVENNTVTIVDTTGTKWEYNFTENYNKDDKVKIYFNENKTTDNRKDDIIIKIKKY